MYRVVLMINRFVKGNDLIANDFDLPSLDSEDVVYALASQSLDMDNQTYFPTEPVLHYIAPSTWIQSCVCQLSSTLRTWLDRGTVVDLCSLMVLQSLL